VTVGFVSLVGAGPGDPELITVKGLSRLQRCDVVVYDRLIDPRILAHVPDEAERIFVGKASGFAVLSQRAIEALLIDRARKGKHVVRLKGGDPFVFGRGGEEIASLAEAEVPYEVVPGITSAIAVPAAASVPVTHRDLASCVTIVTAHEDPEKGESSVDWTWLAHAPGTVVVLMGLERVDALSRRLVAEGRNPSTPAMAIASGTLPNQETVSAPLADLPERVARAGLRSPAVIVIGDVAGFPSILAAQELARAV
jgi:uroporphyrinogen III methyltransferase / synthase